MCSGKGVHPPAQQGPPPVPAIYPTYTWGRGQAPQGRARPIPCGTVLGDGRQGKGQQDRVSLGLQEAAQVTQTGSSKIGCKTGTDTWGKAQSMRRRRSRANAHSQGAAGGRRFVATRSFTLLLPESCPTQGSPLEGLWRPSPWSDLQPDLNFCHKSTLSTLPTAAVLPTAHHTSDKGLISEYQGLMQLNSNKQTKNNKKEKI